MPDSPQPVARNFLQGWFWNNAIALGGGLGMGFVLFNCAALFFLIGGNTPDMNRALLLIGVPLGAAAMGALLGYFQQSVLRAYFPMKYWLLATMLGASISGLVAITSSTFLLPGWVVGSMTLFGAGLGIVQWLILRAYVFRSAVWVLGSALSGLAAGGMIDLARTAVAMLPNSPPITLGNITFTGGAAMVADTLMVPILFSVGCAVVSSITGVTMRWLLHYPKHAGYR